LGIKGEIISTTGHGPDHVTLVLDEGIAFTGDLPPENASPEDSGAFKDWKYMRKMNVTRFYPAHGAFNLPFDQKK
jgi:endoribonuclease LACTB2